jgi:hypothetical protein
MDGGVCGLRIKEMQGLERRVRREYIKNAQGNSIDIPCLEAGRGVPTPLALLGDTSLVAVKSARDR